MLICENVSKIYKTKHNKINALNNVNVKIPNGQFVVLKGPSGSGKTTLLMAAGAMLRPTTGNIQIDGQNIYNLNPRGRAEFRADKIGFIFQMFHLLPYLNILDNILLASPKPKSKTVIERAHQLLTELGLAERIDHMPSQLSAGEKQRTAIARAMLNEPAIILADEPTGNLDRDNAHQVIAHLSDFHHTGGTVLLATHQDIADSAADIVIKMDYGSICEN